jgi:hypothetical protein
MTAALSVVLNVFCRFGLPVGKLEIVRDDARALLKLALE